MSGKIAPYMVAFKVYPSCCVHTASGIAPAWPTRAHLEMCAAAVTHVVLLLEVLYVQDLSTVIAVGPERLQQGLANNHVLVNRIGSTSRNYTSWSGGWPTSMLCAALTGKPSAHGGTTGSLPWQSPEAFPPSTCSKCASTMPTSLQHCLQARIGSVT